MFDRYNDQARRIIIDAQSAAAGMGHHFVGPEHFLVALTRDMDTAVRVKATQILRGNGFRQDESRDLIRAFHGAPGEAFDGKVPFTPEAKTVLENAWRLADSFSHRQISAEHLLLAITDLSGGAAGTVLGMFCTVADVRAHLTNWLTHLQEDPEPASA